ncbi:hypothetical protein SAMN05216327_109290 [Dyadobacter sp. SG02]|uniref:hypothetical protein n=1 Tax=Dyadobacter sp. SG02 TaxID=1855291 RepID=UPI0008BDDDD1|nr:hypothetical protein [Dyadobacter sp. SG02]SEJ40516.1 hypothetical protein SAMN05216327_109290 [Dyadobacter sp. SG02]
MITQSPSAQESISVSDQLRPAEDLLIFFLSMFTIGDQESFLEEAMFEHGDRMEELV